MLSIIIAPSLAIGGVGGGKGASFCLHLHYSVRQWEHNAATTVTVCFHCAISLAAYRSRDDPVIPSYLSSLFLFCPPLGLSRSFYFSSTISCINDLDIESYDTNNKLHVSSVMIVTQENF